MYGHQTPCRLSAWRPAHVARKHPLLLVLLLSAALTAVALFAAGCGSGGADDTTTTVASVSTTAPPVSTTASTATQPTDSTFFSRTVTDDNNETVTINAKPMRIVTTAPANTEIVFALGAGDRVVGVTSLDDYPPEVAGIAKIGDFQPNAEAIIALDPDLVLGYSGNEEALAPVKSTGVPVLIFNPSTLQQIYANIATIGAVLPATARVDELIESIKAQIKAVSDAATATGESPKVFYALDNTLWTSGPGSFVDELLTLAHATNVASVPGADGAAAQKYYQFAPEQLIAADPDVILLPGSVYRSAEEFTGDPRFTGLKAVKEGRVLVIDDVIVTRPGPRIAAGLEILARAIHPGAF